PAPSTLRINAAGSSARSSSQVARLGSSLSSAPSMNSMLSAPPRGNRTTSMGSAMPGCSTVATGPHSRTVSNSQRNSSRLCGLANTCALLPREVMCHPLYRPVAAAKISRTCLRLQEQRLILFVDGDSVAIWIGHDEGSTERRGKGLPDDRHPSLLDPFEERLSIARPPPEGDRGGVGRRTGLTRPRCAN